MLPPLQKVMVAAVAVPEEEPVAASEGGLSLWLLNVTREWD